MEQSWSVIHPTPGSVETAVESWLESLKVINSGHHHIFGNSSRRNVSTGGKLVKKGSIENEAIRGVRVCDGPIWALSCSIRGSIAVGCCDGIIRIRRLGLLVRHFESQEAPNENVELRGHTGAVLHLAWGPAEKSDKDELLISVSEDKTARLWRVLSTSGSCIMVCSHGGAVISCAFLHTDSFVTGGFDRTVRIWHIPSGRATAWAHCNDAITSIAATKARIVGPKSKDGRRIAVGLRGGQIFTYTSKAHNDLLFDEMVLTTMRAGAFLEAERCGATGIDQGKNNHEEDISLSREKMIQDTECSITAAESDNSDNTNIKKSKSKFSAKKLKQRLFGSTKGTQKSSPPTTQNNNFEPAVRDAERYSDDFEPAPPTFDHEDDAAPYGPPAATVEYVERRVTELSWYAIPIDPDYPTKELHERIRLLAASNGESVMKVFLGARPDKPPKLRLDGGARIVLGCGARPSASGNVAVGASEDGALLFWHLNEPSIANSGVSSAASGDASVAVAATPKTPHPPAPLIPPCAFIQLDPPNSRIKAVTAALFAPAQASRSAYTALATVLNIDDTVDNENTNSSVLAECDWSAAFALAADYSGRLLLIAYDSTLRPALLNALRLSRESVLNSPPPPGHAALSPQNSLLSKTLLQEQPIQQQAQSPQPEDFFDTNAQIDNSNNEPLDHVLKEENPTDQVPIFEEKLEQEKPDDTNDTANNIQATTAEDDVSTVEHHNSSYDSPTIDLDEIGPVSEVASPVGRKAKKEDDGLPAVAPAIPLPDAADRMSATSVRSGSHLVKKNSNVEEERSDLEQEKSVAVEEVYNADVEEEEESSDLEQEKSVAVEEVDNAEVEEEENSHLEQEKSVAVELADEDDKHNEAEEEQVEETSTSIPTAVEDENNAVSDCAFSEDDGHFHDARDDHHEFEENGQDTHSERSFNPTTADDINEKNA